MIDVTEPKFEENIIETLIKSGYRTRKSADYDKEQCLIPEDLLEFIKNTQPKMWEKLKKQRGANAEEGFLKRLTDEIERRGTLDVLRKGIKDLGCKFNLVYFKPASTLNVEHMRQYNQNIFTIVRQLHYSTREPQNTLDMAIFLNGLPIITMELKNPLTGQNAEDAIKQYRTRRDPREKLFKFKRCLSHFTVDPDLIYMSTHLTGKLTEFIPFNKGHNEGAGNPPNPHGYKISYFLEDTLQKDSILDVISNFLTIVKEEEKDSNRRTIIKEKLIFPRYHQLDAVKKLIACAEEDGPGNNYLIQHSAGSGKSNTIAWLCHHLCGLHDVNDKRIFDSIIVISDRRVIDKQLRDTVRQFEQVRGTVETIERHKSKRLTEALELGKDIIVTTIQTFPFAVELISELKGKNFAVVIDEAHSSQTGKSARSVKEVLTYSSLETAEDEPEEYDEDLINAKIEENMKRRGRLPNVSFFAFTATPKNKTLELFGTPTAGGEYEPFHLYSMKQAIEENFILNVLENYTTYKTFFNLSKRIEEDPEYEKKKAIKVLKQYVDLHEHAIDKKTEIMIEHFWNIVKNRIGDKAKGMVVSRSRLHAVRYKLAFDKYIREKGYNFKTLVAFSGTVEDPETGEKFTESGMNGFPEGQTVEKFEEEDYWILIVANKFQTGFDQPLLHTMYVDKKLGGIHAVQTLSRLNRKCPGKKDTMVLDFVNTAQEIQEAFQPYYKTAILSEGTDPNILYNLQRILEDYYIFEPRDVENFAMVYFSPKGTQEVLHALLDPIIDVYDRKPPDEQERFRKDLKSYVRLYSFLSHIITFTDADLEKLYQFARFLVMKLSAPRDGLPTDIKEKIDMDSYGVRETSSGEIRLMDEDGELHPLKEIKAGKVEKKQMEALSRIIRYMNERFGGEFAEDVLKHFYDDIERRLLKNQHLVKMMNPEINPPENIRLIFDNIFDSTLYEMMNGNLELYKKIVDDDDLNKYFKTMMFLDIYGKLTGEEDVI